MTGATGLRGSETDVGAGRRKPLSLHSTTVVSASVPRLEKWDRSQSHGARRALMRRHRRVAELVAEGKQYFRVEARLLPQQAEVVSLVKRGHHVMVEETEHAAVGLGAIALALRRLEDSHPRPAATCLIHAVVVVSNGTCLGSWSRNLNAIVEAGNIDTRVCTASDGGVGLSSGHCVLVATPNGLKHPAVRETLSNSTPWLQVVVVDKLDGFLRFQHDTILESLGSAAWRNDVQVVVTGRRLHGDRCRATLEAMTTRFPRDPAFVPRYLKGEPGRNVQPNWFFVNIDDPNWRRDTVQDFMACNMGHLLVVTQDAAEARRMTARGLSHSMLFLAPHVSATTAVRCLAGFECHDNFAIITTVQDAPVFKELCRGEHRYVTIFTHPYPASSPAFQCFSEPETRFRHEISWTPNAVLMYVDHDAAEVGGFIEERGADPLPADLHALAAPRLPAVHEGDTDTDPYNMRAGS